MGNIVVNDYGARVLKGCLSCKHKTIDSFGGRKCKKTNISIKDKYDVCSCWAMMEAFRKVRKYADGNVDPHCYEKFVKLRDSLTPEQQWLRGFSKECPYETGKQQASED